ncbi:MAG TPA: CoA-binding protein [Chloroflexota bacterium]|nr:CoA-binding protein [Chloroflexota bacterium]
MTTIDDFFGGTRYATVGLDPTQAYGQAVIKSLNAGARRAFAVFPELPEGMRTIAGELFQSLRDVPGPLDGVILNIEGDPQRMLKEVELAVSLGVPRIWIENRCEAREAVEYALAHGVEVVDNVCPLMVLDPHHIHWIHRKALDVFGKTPHVQEPEKVPA